MRTLHQTTLLLAFPAIAWLVTGCNQTEAPSEPQSPEATFDMGGSHTLWVNDDGIPTPTGSSCNNPNFKRIQDAVNAATPGDRINVCEGNYVEQVTIPAGKDNITLRSVKRWDAIIHAPPVMTTPKAIVRVNGAHNVTIVAFTITGPGGGPCDFLEYGVRVDMGGSADILGNHITEIRDTPFSGCQNGVGVQVGRLFDPMPPDLRPPDITVGTANIIGNVIDKYQKNGVTIDNAGSSAEIKHNRILGIGPTAVIAQNGAQVSRGATAEIEHNFIAYNIYSPRTVASAGVLLFQSGQVLTDHNDVIVNDVNIYMFDAASGTATTHNMVRAATFDGIALQQEMSSGNQVEYNMTEENAGPGIGMYDARNNSVENNHVEDNQDSGILLDNAHGNTVGDNQVRDNGTPGGDVTDGIRAEATSDGNTIENNHLRDNVTHDCHDNSVMGNTWVGNHGETAFPPGLCDKDPNDAAFATTETFGWDPNYPWTEQFGIALDYDWAAAYATVDTESLLQLLPAIGLPTHRKAASPNP